MRDIYLHGLGQTTECWKYVIENIYNTENSDNIDLIKLLQDKEVTYRNMYESFCDTCNKNSEKNNLCGLSLGGVLALNYALDYPEKVNSLILIATQYKMPKMLLSFQNIIFKFMPNSSFYETGFKNLILLNYVKQCLK